MTTLARRAIASRHWQWLPGCLLTYGDHINPDAPRKQYRVIGGDLSAHVLSGDPLPVLDDAATMGCLLALARKAWGDPGLHARIVYRHYPLLTQEWSVPVAIARSFRAATEAEVLLIALEAAP